MTFVVRRFNEAGISEFTDRLERLRAGQYTEIDDGLVTGNQFTAVIEPAVRIEKVRFTTKHDVGSYLGPRLQQILQGTGDRHPGLWAWLSAWFWDSVCPVDSDGKRKVLNPYHYVFGYGNEQNSKKHLIAMAVKLYGAAPGSKLLLRSPCWSATKIGESISTRLALLRVPGLLQLLDALYWDEANGRPKAGVADPRVVRPGDLATRLPVRIRQLEMTYDLVDLTADQLLNLLGDEFKGWTNGRTPPRPKTTRRSAHNAHSPDDT